MNEDIKEWLNKLIGSEIIAMLQYEIAAKIATGTDWDSCVSEFTKHADEEREHMRKLMECAVERDIYFDQDVASLIVNAQPSYSYMEGKSTKELVTFQFKSEENAIKLYRQFYDIIEHRDITLAQCIKDILHDEIEHRKDMKKIFGSIDDIKESVENESTIFENFSNRLNKINFSILNDIESKKAEKIIMSTIKNRNDDVVFHKLTKDKNGNFTLIVDIYDEDTDKEFLKALKENLNTNVGQNIKFSIEDNNDIDGSIRIIPAKLNSELSRKYGKLLLPPQR